MTEQLSLTANGGNPNSAESLKKNGDTDTILDKLPKVDYTKLNKTEKDIMKFGLNDSPNSAGRIG